MLSGHLPFPRGWSLYTFGRPNQPPSNLDIILIFKIRENGRVLGTKMKAVIFHGKIKQKPFPWSFATILNICGVTKNSLWLPKVCHWNQSSFKIHCFSSFFFQFVYGVFILIPTWLRIKDTTFPCGPWTSVPNVCTLLLVPRTAQPGSGTWSTHFRWEFLRDIFKTLMWV